MAGVCEKRAGRFHIISTVVGVEIGRLLVRVGPIRYPDNRRTDVTKEPPIAVWQSLDNNHLDRQ
jgi:hypothetical protein